ncbi:Uncharacterised protein [Vibrio cholerae]|nr:Uncharacterised protein [Vibrio cholerae]
MEGRTESHPDWVRKTHGSKAQSLHPRRAKSALAPAVLQRN